MEGIVPKDYGPPEIEPDEIQLFDELLGSGSYGNVYAGECRAQEVAVKVLNNQEMSESDLETFRKEIIVMSKIHHPNIVLYMGACTVPGELKIVTERMNGDLSSLLHKSTMKLSLLQKMKLARDCALGMSWLHGSQNPIIHHDLKPSNCLVDDNMRVKITDFGLSVIKIKGEFVFSEVPKGTAIYMAPEVYEGCEYDEKCDVFSFGIILWEIYTRMEPYKDVAESLSVETFCQIVGDQNLRPEIPEDCPAKIKSLLESCWSGNPDERLNFAAIVDKLNEIIIEEAILDPTGRNFWKRNYNAKDKVQWQQFVRDFTKLLEIDRGAIDQDLLLVLPCLKELIVKEDFVTLELFGKMLDYFGPIRRNGTKKKFLPDLKKMLSQTWFHGEMDAKDTGSALYQQEDGTFLVRFSSSERGYFTISTVHDTKPLHIRIKHPPLKDEYSTSKIVYPTLIDLVIGEAATLNLKTPCPGSRFAYLLSQTTSEYFELYQYYKDYL